MSCKAWAEWLQRSAAFSPRRLLAYAWREMLEIRRYPGPTRLRPSWHRLFDGIFALHFALGKAPEFLIQFLVKSTLWRLH
jgi:hypothetical protein